jgi:3-dehydroquinate synthase
VTRKPAGKGRSLVITGFMGTGKSAVGREVARQMDRPFLDMDAEIEARAGKAIPRIFAEDGEPAFRKLEADLCRELSAREGLVVATGGGALVNPDNRRVMVAGSTVVCLSATPEVILQRVGGDEGRPLLNVPDPRAEVERLLALRHDAYRAIPWQVDTGGLPVDEVAAQVLEVVGVVTLPVSHPGGEYPIHVGAGILSRVGDALRAVGVAEGAHVAVATNSVVGPLYAARVEESLQAAGLHPFVCTIPDGERHKNLDTVAALYDCFLDGRLDRSGVVLALGGGVTGDVVGFAAASFLRGVRLVQVPTTLLAMVDSSVGGKTGVDLPQGKNLAGAFKQPELVLVDPTVLQTLPADEMRCGVVEAIKNGIIGAPGLFEELGPGADPSSWWGERGADWIARAARVKVEVVEEDPFERDRRAVLNLGHTTGHALEQVSGFALRHGEAVGIGMVAAARIAVEMNLTTSALADRVQAVLTAWGAPVRCPPHDAEAIYEAMAHDKKRRGKGLRWVLPRAIGEVDVFEDVDRSLVLSVLRALGAR